MTPDQAKVQWPQGYAQCSLEPCSATSKTAYIPVAFCYRGVNTTTTTITIPIQPRKNIPPVARIAVSKAGVSLDNTVPLTINFDGSNSYDPDQDAIVSYTWTFGDGSSGSGAVTSHRYVNPGTYAAILTVMDSRNAKGSTSVQIRADPAISTPITDKPTLCSTDKDRDCDGYVNDRDNCPSFYNPDQADSDRQCSMHSGVQICNLRNDGVGDACDVCPDVSDPDQADQDHDSVGDACDSCWQVQSDRSNPDNDHDCLSYYQSGAYWSTSFGWQLDPHCGDACDKCPGFDDTQDSDKDTVPDGCDNCMQVPNPDQAETTDNDGVGDACDICAPGLDEKLDADKDRVPDCADNCQGIQNVREYMHPNCHGVTSCQPDLDQNGVGDACDCKDLFQGPNEAGIDCGDACGVTCGNVKIEGIMKYEDAEPTTRGNIPSDIKPIRYARVSLIGSGKQEVTTESGYFSFIVPQTPGKVYHIKLEAINYAANVQRDRDACNEYVWWETESFTIPETGNIDLGERIVGNTSVTNVGLTGYWQESHHHWVCGGERRLLRIRNSAYFNIAEDVLLERTYADDPTHRADNDAIGVVYIQYPEAVEVAGASWTNPISDEIYLRAAEGGRDTGFLDETIFHEYTHFLSDQISENDWALHDHNFCTADHGVHDDEEFAWFEGFAEYMSALMTTKYRELPYKVSQEGQMYPYIEDPYRYTSAGCDRTIPDSGGKKVEGAICALLWDLADEPISGAFSGSKDEWFDSISGKDAMIFMIFDTFGGDTPEVCDFFTTWQATYHGTPEATGIVPLLNNVSISCG